ncbi:MAG TPA: hypothetical protein VKA84_17190 [Gemmatimonadaceae bacterium]|nr:hypothetical protein [Gemmatimonadaceae bacterium]
MRNLALFSLVLVALVAAAGWVLGLKFASPAEHRAIWTSAAVAVAVQLVAFAALRLASREQLFAAWGLGAVMRLLVLAAYGLVVAGALGLPSAAALVSLAAFFFVSTIVEPLLLKS